MRTWLILMASHVIMTTDYSKKWYPLNLEVSKYDMKLNHALMKSFFKTEVERWQHSSDQIDDALIMCQGVSVVQISSSCEVWIFEEGYLNSGQC